MKFNFLFLIINITVLKYLNKKYFINKDILNYFFVVVSQFVTL